ncbi:MAG: hypothetical protein WKG01_25575 [Kofleriaceae bacterium]
MNNKLVTAALTFFAARSPRVRKLAPFIPLALGALAYLKKRRTSAQLTTAGARV